jgi:hypothetical protein
MSPGMNEKNKKEGEFARDIDLILTNNKAEIDKTNDEEYLSDIDFAEKILECRVDPSPSFHEGLKKRLLLKLAEEEEVKSRNRPVTTSFWSWLTGLVPQSPALRTAAVTVTVAVLALLVVWAIGLFAPGHGQEPIVTGPLAPAVAVETRATTTKTAFTTGEEIDIHFSFRNLTDETLTFPFPPEIRIGDLGTEVLRTFDVGQGTMTLAPGQTEDYDLTWDQKDESGNQVPPGDYQIIIPNIQLEKGKGVVSLVESPILSISNNP